MIKEIKINSDNDVLALRSGADAVASSELLTLISALDKCGGQYCIIMDVIECNSYAVYKHKLLQINALLEQLTKRESEVLQLVIKGMHNKAISAALNISVETVKSHRKKIVSKVGIHKVHDVLNILYDIFVSKKLQREIIHPDLTPDNVETHS